MTNNLKEISNISKLQIFNDLFYNILWTVMEFGTEYKKKTTWCLMTKKYFCALCNIFVEDSIRL